MQITKLETLSYIPVTKLCETFSYMPSESEQMQPYTKDGNTTQKKNNLITLQKQTCQHQVICSKLVKNIRVIIL